MQNLNEPDLTREQIMNMETPNADGNPPWAERAVRDHRRQVIAGLSVLNALLHVFLFLLLLFGYVRVALYIVLLFACVMFITGVASAPQANRD